MDHSTWDADQDDGSCVERFSLEGEEQTPPPWSTRQFHLYTLHGHMQTYRLAIPRGAHFSCYTRMHRGGEIFVAGWETPDGGGAWLFVNPEGEVELGPWEMHVPRFTPSVTFFLR